MVQCRCRLGFLHETAAAFVIPNAVRGQHLHGHETGEMRVAGLVHHAHPALADLFEDLIVRHHSSGERFPSGHPFVRERSGGQIQCSLFQEIVRASL
jgi:hypothetical protein